MDTREDEPAKHTKRVMHLAPPAMNGNANVVGSAESVRTDVNQLQSGGAIFLSVNLAGSN